MWSPASSTGSRSGAPRRSSTSTTRSSRAPDVFHGPRLAAGIRLWLDMVARHRVRVVLIDTVNKSEGRRLLKESDGDARGYLTRGEILKLTAYARDRSGEGPVGGRHHPAAGLHLRETRRLRRLRDQRRGHAPARSGGRLAATLSSWACANRTSTRSRGSSSLLEAGFLVGRGATDSPPMSRPCSRPSAARTSLRRPTRLQAGPPSSTVVARLAGPPGELRTREAVVTRRP